MMSGNVVICEIFIVGEKQWKDKDEFPPVTLCGEDVCILEKLGSSYSKQPDNDS